jgi:hypothetical protein
VLRAGCGAWELEFAGGRAVLKGDLGLSYVAYLLLHSGDQPLHAVQLVARVRGRSADQDLPACEIIQRSLGLDAVESSMLLLEQEARLQAVLEDPDALEPVKTEAARHLEELAHFQKTHAFKTTDLAAKVSDSVRKAIRRFLRRLETARDANDLPHPVLGAFAAHLHSHLRLPSRGSHGSTNAGCYAYTPPPDTRWVG